MYDSQASVHLLQRPPCFSECARYGTRQDAPEQAGAAARATFGHLCRFLPTSPGSSATPLSTHLQGAAAVSGQCLPHQRAGQFRVCG